MLRLVHPGDGGNVPPRRFVRSPVLSLTEEEARHARAAIRGVARTYGGYRALAKVLELNPNTFSKRGRPAPGLIIAVARLAHISVEAMLSGKLTEAGVCVACGARGGAR